MKNAVRIAAFAAAALLTAAAWSVPAAAQSGSTWHDQKMFDLKSHERGKAYDDRATGHYQSALAHIQRVEELAELDERNERQEKRLQKAYEKATEHLEEAIEVSPEFTAARMMLGAVHYKMKAYQAARAAYLGVLEREPDNQDAKSYLSSVEWYLQRSGSADAESGGG